MKNRLDTVKVLHMMVMVVNNNPYVSKKNMKVFLPLSDIEEIPKSMRIFQDHEKDHLRKIVLIKKDGSC